MVRLFLRRLLEKYPKTGLGHRCQEDLVVLYGISTENLAHRLHYNLFPTADYTIISDYVFLAELFTHSSHFLIGHTPGSLGSVV
jgi:hypothetical protein